MRVEQSHDGSRGGPPSTDSGPDQSFLLVMADHLDEPRAVLSVGLLHKALQVLFQLRWGESDTQICSDVKANSLKPVAALILSTKHQRNSLSSRGLRKSTVCVSVLEMLVFGVC